MSSPYRRRTQGPVPRPLMTAEEVADAMVDADAVQLSLELGRTRDLVFYLVGALEGIAMRHPDVAPTADKARSLIRD